jgi:hypothetical protein
MNGTKKMIAGLVSAFALVGAAQAATVNVTADITTSTRWTADNEYILNTVVYVRDGATLWIEPGTVVRGQPGISPLTTALWITRGGKLIAKGTKEKPIIFTDLVDNNFPWVDYAHIEEDYKTINPHNLQPVKSKQWGGLVMCGQAYIADQDVADPVSHPRILASNAEGLVPDGQGSTLYGGGDDDDCSGSLSYVSVRYGGFKLTADVEVNGITLCGIGRGTEIHHVEVVGNQDDGIEFFGGTVNTKHVAILAIGDDSFDVDQGYRGRCQFLFIMQGYCNSTDGAFGGGWGNHAFEMDGAENYDANQPWGLQRYENVTIVGMNTKGSAGNYTSGGEVNSHAFQLDDNCRAQFFNVIVMDVDHYLAVVEDGGTSVDSFEGLTTAATEANFPAVVNTAAGVATYAPYYYRGVQNTNYNQTAFRNFVIYNCYNNGRAAKSNSSNVPGTDITTTGWDWNVATSLPIRFLQRESASDPTRPMPSGYVGSPNVRLIDPRPVMDWVDSPYSTKADGFATPVNYYGAFAPTGDTWLEGWSALSTSRMLTNTLGDAEIVLDEAAFSVGFVAAVGETYTLQETTDLVNGPWLDVAGAKAVVADKANMTLADFGVTGQASKFYKVISE